MEVGKNMIYEKNNTIIHWLNNGKGTWPANQSSLGFRTQLTQVTWLLKSSLPSLAGFIKKLKS